MCSECLTAMLPARRQNSGGANLAANVCRSGLWTLQVAQMSDNCSAFTQQINKKFCEPPMQHNHVAHIPVHTLCGYANQAPNLGF